VAGAADERAADRRRALRCVPEAARRNTGDDGAIETNTRVLAITRNGADKVTSSGREAKPFVLAVSNSNGAGRRDLARAVIDASGTWTNSNPLGAGGVPAEGEAENATCISYGIPDVLGRDRATYMGKTVLIVGPGIRPPTSSSISPASPHRTPELRLSGRPVVST
jgi:hypothetical protein